MHVCHDLQTSCMTRSKHLRQPASDMFMLHCKQDCQRCQGAKLQQLGLCCISPPLRCMAAGCAPGLRRLSQRPTQECLVADAAAVQHLAAARFAQCLQAQKCHWLAQLKPGEPALQAGHAPRGAADSKLRHESSRSSCCCCVGCRHLHGQCHCRHGAAPCSGIALNQPAQPCSADEIVKAVFSSSHGFHVPGNMTANP